MNKLTITTCIEQILERMRELQYSETTITMYTSRYRTFLKFCKGNEYLYYEEKIGLDFLEETYGLQITSLASFETYSKTYSLALRIQKILSIYSQYQIFYPRFVKSSKALYEDAYWNSIYDNFLLYLEQLDYASSTIQHKELTLRRTINFFIQNNISSISDIKKQDIINLISLHIHEAPKSLSHRVGELKQFFSFLYEENFSAFNLSFWIPPITTPHTFTLPLSWDAATITKLLESIDRENPAGKRDYAIILLACRLGLRGIDIVNLQLSNLNWETKEIVIRQQKTQYTITLPLLNDIGWALIDYIKNARPNSNDTTIFLRMNPPFTPMSCASSLTAIFKRRFADAQIPIPREQKFGIHSLRHTLGRILLEKETPLPIISQILGHQSIQSTETYLHINMRGLEACSIDPDKVFSNEL